MNTRRVIFVNRFYWPDEPATAQLLTDLAEALANRGHAIEVIARQPKPNGPREETRNGVQIHRVATTRFGRRRLLGRSFDFATFIWGTRRALAKRLRRGDVVVTMTDPPMLGAALAGLAERRGAASVHWIQDIFPEVAIAVSGRSLPRILLGWRNQAWRRARHCVVPGEDMAEFVHRQGVAPSRLTVCENWAPAGLRKSDGAAWRARHGLADRFLVMYSGNLGRVHDFDAILPLAQALHGKPDVALVFVGEGARRARLEAAARTAGASNVLFFPPEPRASLSEMLSAADLHLITLRAGCELFVFPSKLYGIAAVESPALYLGPIAAEVSRTISAHGFGAGFAPSQIGEIVEFIHGIKTSAGERARLSCAARDFNASRGGVERAVELWQGVLTPLIQLADRGFG